MLRSYLLSAWRHLVRRRVYTAINLLGLAVGVAFCLLAWTLVAYERSFDAFHPKADRVFRVVSTLRLERPLTTGVCPAETSTQLASDFPQVIRVGRLDYDPDFSARVVRVEGRIFESGVGWADSSLFRVLSFPVIAGDPIRAISAPTEVVLSRKAAQRLFGHPQVVGRSLDLREQGTWLPLIVGAVIEIPANSTYQPDLLLAWQRHVDPVRAAGQALLELAGPDDAAVIESQLPAFVERHYSAEIAALRQFLGPECGREYRLQPLRDMHGDPLVGGTPGATDLAYAWVLLALAAVVLLIACANFVNLSMALG
ncbi:MAG: ABC transporter permease, partial [Candidatus Latescibacterota bacterium]